MKFSYTFPLRRPADEAWAKLLENPEAMIRCIPGVEEVEVQEDNKYGVVLSTGLGPVRLRFRGNAQVQTDEEARRLQADVSMSDARSGNVYGKFLLGVLEDESNADASQLLLESDVAIGGKLGEFAQPLLKRKADQVVKEFAKKVQDLTGA